MKGGCDIDSSKLVMPGNRKQSMTHLMRVLHATLSLWYPSFNIRTESYFSLSELSARPFSRPASRPEVRLNANTSPMPG